MYMFFFFVFFFTFDLLLWHSGVPSDLSNTSYPRNSDIMTGDVCHGDAVAMDVFEENLSVPSCQSACLLPREQFIIDFLKVEVYH